VLLKGAAEGCRCKNAAVRVLFALCCWCRCRVPLQSAAVRVLFVLFLFWSLVAGACGFVLLFGVSASVFF